MTAAHVKPQIVQSLPMQAHPAVDYLQGTFCEGDHIFFFGVHAWKTHLNVKGDSVADVKKYELMPLSVAVRPKTMARLERDQANDWNIFVSMNPFPEGSPSRVESLIKTIRNVFIETDGGEVLKTIALAVADDIIPAPHSILQSSPGKYHVVWHVEGIPPHEAKALNRALASRFGGDPACVDLHRVLRMPGFRNLKPKYPDRPVCELVEPMLGDPPYTRNQFKIETVILKANGAAVSDGVLANIISAFEQNAGEAGFKLGPRAEDLHGYRWDVTCPWAETHTYGGKDAILMVLKDGRLEFSCLHHHCAQRGWSDIRQLWETAAGHKQKFAAVKELEEMILSKDGTVRAILANAITMLKTVPCWQDVLAYNELTLLPMKLKPAPWDTHTGVTSWSDHDDTKLAEYFERHGLFIDSSKRAGEAAQAVAREHSFHPVRDYLDSLKWDGKRRLNSMLPRYFGAQGNRYVYAIGRCWMIAAVARIYRPGCKVDNVLTLEGDQGRLKSTALAVLAGDEFFLDDFAEVNDKDQLLKMHGAWIVEMAELAGTRRDVNRVKAFLTCRDDVFRAPYDRRPQHHPRMNVFAASTNDETWLTDETGGRRFWPVKCGKIEIEKLRKDRDQLWAEAVIRFRKGEEWWFVKPDLDATAEEEQRGRYQSGQWDEVIELWLENPVQRREFVGTDTKGKGGEWVSVQPWRSSQDKVTVDDILLHAINKPVDRWTQPDKNSVAKCLKVNKWKRVLEREGKEVRKYYCRPDVTV